eukprot:TRINITY_DN13609_c1_g1_i1.p1 TRINITY_DN13609_c1_g1~~TRINITY_DN13609_c1_g1_i1.p1  ORF type:complete len:398 (-),score=36.59 TRINITY_DN13609_c1_g1_i1:128-1321(-)
MNKYLKTIRISTFLYKELELQFLQSRNFCQSQADAKQNQPKLSDPAILSRRQQSQFFLEQKLKMSSEQILECDKKSGKMLLFNEKDTLNTKINLVMDLLECNEQTLVKLLSRSPKMLNPQTSQLQKRIEFWLNDIKCVKANLRNTAIFWMRPQEEIEKVCEELQKRGFEKPKELLRGFPKLATYSYEVIDQKMFSLQQLLQLQSREDTVKVIERNPRIFSHSQDKIVQVIEWFGNNMFTREESYRMIEDDPVVLDLSINRIQRGWDQLLDFCNNQQAIARQVVLGRPTNLGENLLSETQQLKFKFLENELGMNPMKVLEECPLITRYSLKGRLAPRILFIRTRKKKDIEGLLPLLVLPDERFVESMGDCKLSEYQNFVKTEFEEFQWNLIWEQLQNS